MVSKEVVYWIIGIVIFLAVANQMGFIDLGTLFQSVNPSVGVNPTISGVGGGGG